MENNITAAIDKEESFLGKTPADAGASLVQEQSSSAREVIITPEDLDELKMELQGCPPCLEFVESLKTTMKLCRDFAVDHAPDPLAPDTRLKMVEAYERMLARRGETSA